MTNHFANLTHGFKISPRKDARGRPLSESKGILGLQYTYFVRSPRFRSIVFKGGGGRTWVYKKFLRLLEEGGDLHYVKEYGGSSAGALFAVLAAMPLTYREREQIIDELTFHKDILGDSAWSTAYRVFFSPLYLISKPLALTSQLFYWASEQCHKVRGGFLLSWLFQLPASLISALATLTHPHAAAGLWNLITKGGIYRGVTLQNYIQDALHRGTVQCLERFIDSIDNRITKRSAVNALLKLDTLIARIHIDHLSGKCAVSLRTKNITFLHFHQLSHIKGLGFKDIFLTATRCRDLPTEASRLKIFNVRNEPHRAIYEAVRMSMSAPIIYQMVYDRGVGYMDGGCADNFPILHASRRRYVNRFEEKHFRGMHGQDLDVLGVRVEYENELGILHEPVYAMRAWRDQWGYRINKFLFNLFCGMDIYTPNDSVQDAVRERYALRVLQLYDHGVGFTEVDIEAQRKNRILACEEKRITSYLRAHRSALSYVKNFDSFSSHEATTQCMPRHYQQKLLRLLCNKKIPDENIFVGIPSQQSLPYLREQLIITLIRKLYGEKSPRLKARPIHHPIAVLRKASTDVETKIPETKQAPSMILTHASRLFSAAAPKAWKPAPKDALWKYTRAR